MEQKQTEQSRATRRWRARVRITVVLVVAWLIIGPIASILLAGPLNQIQMGGVPLGFWMAQQGSIIGFVIIILIYAVLMDRVDKRG